MVTLSLGNIIDSLLGAAEHRNRTSVKTINIMCKWDNIISKIDKKREIKLT